MELIFSIVKIVLFVVVALYHLMCMFIFLLSNKKEVDTLWYGVCAVLTRVIMMGMFE